MASRRLTTATVTNGSPPREGIADGAPRASGPGLATALPAAVVLALLLAATLFDGAFHVRHWAPVTLLAVAMLAAIVAAGGTPRLPGWAQAALAGGWGLSAWSLLSVTWSSQPGAALEGGARMVLYAALVSVPLLTPLTSRHLRALRTALAGGLALLALVTLVRILAEAKGVFLAGRLDAPIGYRNATAALFAVAFWPLVCVAAQRGANAVLRAACASAAALALGLAFLTQSRGVALGLAVGGAVALVLGPDRLRRAWTAVLVVALVAAASPLLLEPYDAFDAGRGTVTDTDVLAAGRALAVVTLASFCLSLLLFLFDNGLRERAHAVARKLAGVALAAGVVVALAGALAVVGNPVDYASDKLDEFRSLETTTTGGTRLGSVSGQRYDLWRIAWREFTDHPLAGAGVGGYELAYFRERHTDRNVVDAHSLPLGLLAETGIVGFGCFALLLGGLLWPLAAALRRGDERRLRGIAGLAAGGVTLVAQTAVDWLALIPGITGLGLLALALAAAGTDPRRRVAAPRLPLRLAGAGALALAGVAVALLFLSDLYVREARQQAGNDPQAQLDAARTAGSLNPWALEPVWLEASALESLGRVGEARRTLEDALADQPDGFVTYALLGDLEARAGNLDLARDYYRQALERNPRDAGLRKLAAGELGG